MENIFNFVGVFAHIDILGDANPDVNFIVPGKVIKVPANEQIVFGYGYLIVFDERCSKSMGKKRKNYCKRMFCDDNDVKLHVLLNAVDNDQISVVLLTAIPGRTPSCLVLVVVVLTSLILRTAMIDMIWTILVLKIF